MHKLYQYMPNQVVHVISGLLEHCKSFRCTMALYSIFGSMRGLFEAAAPSKISVLKLDVLTALRSDYHSETAKATA